MMFNRIDSISKSLLTTSASSLVVLSAYLLLFSKRRQRIAAAAENDNDGHSTSRSTSSSRRNNRAPPIARAGLMETIKQMSGNDFPWFLLDTARELQSYVYRLNLAHVFFCPMVIVIGKPKIAREILMDPLSTKPKQLYGSFNSVTAGYATMFSTNGKYWHSRRKGMAPAFSSKHIKRMNKVAADKVDEWIQTRLMTFVHNDEAFDVGKEMIDITLSAISETAFEYYMSDKEKEYFLQELELCLKEFVFKTSVNPLRKPFGLLIPERRRAHLAAQRLQAICFKIMNAYRQLENPTKDTIIDRIMNNDAYSNDGERAADILILLIGGHDTTAFSIAWILKELSKNPKEQQNLRDSLYLSEEDTWNQSTVLKNIAKEGMRLHPVATGGSIRSIGRDFTTDEGYLLPKGSIIFFPMNLPLRNTNIYDDADSFIPARWDEPTKEMNDAFYPFSMGKQNCVGQALANAEIHSILPRICSQFELELVDEGTTEYFLTLKPVGTMIKAKKILN